MYNVEFKEYHYSVIDLVEEGLLKEKAVLDDHNGRMTDFQITFKSAQQWRSCHPRSRLWDSSHQLAKWLRYILVELRSQNETIDSRSPGPSARIE